MHVWNTITSTCFLPVPAGLCTGYFQKLYRTENAVFSFTCILSYMYIMREIIEWYDDTHTYSCAATLSDIKP